MGIPVGSQVDALPEDLPFRIISKTIGRGAYASVRKACPLTAPRPVIAVKFIHKQYAFRTGRLSQKQLAAECQLHAAVGKHQHIVQFLSSGEDRTWTWIAMELADGGDLFDKIEADEGVGEDVAHLYFRQLISAVSYMHDRGIAHRDIKPENILLSSSGDLKIADFGLATLFKYQGVTRKATTVCGSAPYMAPDILDTMEKRKRKIDTDVGGYNADKVDIWSCGIVLFVLLVGNTPWDEPTTQSWEYKDFKDGDGYSTDELWQKLPSDVLSLLRGILKVDAQTRFTLETIRKHPWYTRFNPHVGPNGLAANQMSLATQMLESLKINLDPNAASELLSPRRRGKGMIDAMDIDYQPLRLASTQPDAFFADSFDWERPAFNAVNAGLSATQPHALTRNPNDHVHPQWQKTRKQTNCNGFISTQLSGDPSMSQFSATPSVPLSLTQVARNFGDIVPSHSLTRFLSPLSFSLLLPLLAEALHCLGVPIPPFTRDALEGREKEVSLQLKTVDSRKCPLVGRVIVEKWGMDVGNGADGDVLSVMFLKMRGDPVEWRRLFKKVVVLCRDAVLVPGV